MIDRVIWDVLGISKGEVMGNIVFAWGNLWRVISGVFLVILGW